MPKRRSKPVLQKLSSLYQEVRGNAAWDVIKTCLNAGGGLLMQYFDAYFWLVLVLTVLLSIGASLLERGKSFAYRIIFFVLCMTIVTPLSYFAAKHFRAPLTEVPVTAPPMIIKQEGGGDCSNVVAGRDAVINSCSPSQEGGRKNDEDSRRKK